MAGIWNAQGLGKNYMEYADDQGYDILLFAETKGQANRLHAFQRFAPNTMVGLDYRPLYSRMVIMQSLGGSIPTYRRCQ